MTLAEAVAVVEQLADAVEGYRKWSNEPQVWVPVSLTHLGALSILLATARDTLAHDQNRME